MDNEKQESHELEPESNAKADSFSSVVKVDENEPSSIDFSGVAALANNDVQKEKWYVSLGNSVIETLISVGMFLLSILLDVVKALGQVLKGLVFGLYHIGLAIGRFFRKLSRIWREGDASVRASFFVSGFGNFKHGQYVDGAIFLLVEVLFIVFMATSGATNLYNLVVLGEGTYESIFGEYLEFDNGASIRNLILGLVTIVLICLYFFVWHSGVRSAYDAHVIKNNYRFLSAKEDALYYVQHLEEFPKTYFVRERKIKKKDPETGKSSLVPCGTELVFLNPGALYATMRKEYGFPKLSALYVSYIRPNRLNPKIPSSASVFYRNCVQNFYARYRKLYEAAKGSKYSSILVKYLLWEPKKPAETTGFGPVENELTAAIHAHRHTYDKYNRYNPIVRDATNLLDVLHRPELLDQAVFAEDEASRNNLLPAVSRDEEKLNAKVVATRVVCAFECSYEAALQASKLYLKARAQAKKEGRETLEVLAEYTAIRQEKLDAFIDSYDVSAKASRASYAEALRSYEALRPSFDLGKNVFLDAAMSGSRMKKEDALRLYEDYAYAIRSSGDEEAKAVALLAARGDIAERHEKNYAISPLYGEPIRFKKKSKQFLDEKFAVTVLSLPVLGAAIFTVLPLLFSIVIAFTNFNDTGTEFWGSLGIFDWSFDSFNALLGLNGNSDSLLPTFGYVLTWTLTWAFFATFLNYILGIVLALLINNKHIKLKKMWRTFFVISIAIPQFITLLAMSKIFSPEGPVNTWLYLNGYSDNRAIFWLNDVANNAFMPKLMLILINCWVGIPYTMLSTTGILMNIPEDLYESARIDGASPWKQFWKITMPYILFVTGPSLLTTFIGNINNFNVIFFLTGGGPSSTVQSPVYLQQNAQMTDLLITWLYKLSVNNPKPAYGVGSVIGIMIFVVCAFFSLIVYKRLGSTQNEEAFQ